VANSQTRRITGYLDRLLADSDGDRGPTFLRRSHPMFIEEEVLNALHLAKRNGFAKTGPIDLSCNEKVVYWGEVDLDYTFVVFTLQKMS
jgi:hypothetical protein